MTGDYTFLDPLYWIDLIEDEMPRKALTICQPYAHLIALPDSDPWHKRIENRTWHTPYRGPLFIHAGISKKYLQTEDYSAPDMIFGAIIAKCELIDCFPKIWLEAEGRIKNRADVQWIKTHRHTEGPYLWVLANVEPLKEPIYCKGALGLWSAPV